MAREVFAKLSPMQKVQLSRHPNRPYTLDYVARLFDDFVELHGDRRFADDASIVAGLGRYHGRSVVVVGHQKGRSTKENMQRNFGMPNPEGYRKAIRMYELADRFGLPVLTFIDTPGAFPGIGAEERGQSEAIGASLEVMSRARRADHHHRHRRGRLRRRARARRRQPRAGARVQLLLGDHARGLRRHPVEERRHARPRPRRASRSPRPTCSSSASSTRSSTSRPAAPTRTTTSRADCSIVRSTKPRRRLSRLSPDELREDRYQRFRRLGAFVA